jgi:hypothetical protein
MTDTKEREEFEAFFDGDEFVENFTIEPTGEYQEQHVSSAWIVWKHQQQRIADLEAKLADEAGHYQELQMLVGICDCQAGRGDPPADCCAPDCLNVIKGVEKLKAKLAESERQNRELRGYVVHRDDCWYGSMTKGGANYTDGKCVCGLTKALGGG